MADDIVQVIQDAREDAISLSRFMYYPASKMVGRRLAPSIHTLNYYLDYLHGLELIYSQPTGTVIVNGEEIKTVRQAINDSVDSAILGDYQAQLETELAQEVIRATTRENEIGDALDAEVIRASDAEDSISQELSELSLEVAAQKLDTGITATSQNGRLPISQAVKNAQTISMVEYGAAGDGMTDDTAAFELLEANVTGREIDLHGKVYKVDGIPLANKYENGFFSIASIIHPSEFNEQELKFKKHCMQFVTGNRYTGIPRIFIGSDNVFQSFCIVPQTTGLPKLYVTNRANRDDGLDGGNWLKYETYRILEYTFKEDGSDVTVNTFSKPLSIGHASGLGYEIDKSGQLWFYSGYPSDSTTDSNRGDKGYSKIKWLGSATSDSNVSYYQLFPYADTANNRLSKYTHASICLSEDLKHMAVTADNLSTGRADVLVYDFAKLKTATNTLDIMPEIVFELTDDTIDGNQGIAMHDSKVITYYDHPQKQSKVKIYSLSGKKLAEYVFDTYQSFYTASELRGSKGVLNARESEGITVFGNNIYIGYRDYWHTIENTVTYGGKSYASAVTSKGALPTDTNYWQEVDAAYAVGAEAWDAATTYTVNSAARVEVNKRIYKLSSIFENQSKAIAFTNLPRRATYKTLGVRAGGSVVYSDVSTPVIYWKGLKGGTLVAEYSGTNAIRTVSQHGEQYMLGRGTATPLTLETSAEVEALTLLRSNVGAFGAFLASGNTMLSAKNGNNLGLNTYSNDNSIGSSGYNIQLVISGSGITDKKFFASRFSSDVDLGESSKPFKNLYVSVAPTVTSDAREKQQIRTIDEAEIAAAKELRRSIKLYRLNREVDDEHSKGVWHTGVIAQEVVEIMKSYGLDALDYGLVNHVSWDDEAAIIEDGQEIQAARSAGDKYAVRYDELAMFLLAAI